MRRKTNDCHRLGILKRYFKISTRAEPVRMTRLSPVTVVVENSDTDGDAET